MFQYKRVGLENWINFYTWKSPSVCELGAGFFNWFNVIHSDAKIRVGIEIWEPYILNAKSNNCIKIHGDALNYRELLKDYELHTCLLVDILEHFPQDVAYKLIEDLKVDFKKILLMLPVGDHHQDTDVTGFGAHEYQTHRSTWDENEIIKLGFNVNVIDKYFHGEPNKDTRCYFGIYERL
jgi:hypothetical protein